MIESVTITTGARLHFGLIVQGKPDDRTYGGVGVMIDEPGFTLTVRKADSTTIHASPETAERLEKLIPQCRPVGAAFPVEVAVTREIPAHAGLGSGTQLGLAVAMALSQLIEEKFPAIGDLARRAGRSARSAIGTLGFESGGLIAQGELAEDGLLKPSTRRIDFPTDWRFVLVTPPGEAGLYGESEKRAFRELPPMPEPWLRGLLTLQQDLIATATAREFDDFGRRLFDFGEWIGKYFFRIQNGIFVSRRMAELAERLRRDWVFGVGQTSWGPTLFAACENAGDAQALAERIRQSDWSDCKVRVVAALNRGAKIETK
jgi:beta-RFAP synthase